MARSYTYRLRRPMDRPGDEGEWIEADRVAFSGGWLQIYREGRFGMILIRAFSSTTVVEIELVADENGQPL